MRDDEPRPVGDFLISYRNIRGFSNSYIILGLMTGGNSGREFQTRLKKVLKNNLFALKIVVMTLSARNVPPPETGENK